MRRLNLMLLLLGCWAPALAEGPYLTLWNGSDLSTWEFVTNPPVDIASVCHASADGALAAAGKPIGYLVFTPTTFKNFRLHVEWRWTEKPGNGGILVHIASGPKDRQWPLSFQIQLKANRAGDILPMAGATCAELSSPGATQVDRTGVDAEKKPGEWNSCEIVCKNGTIACSVNGVPENYVSHCTPADGRVGFQFEGTPFELRNVRLTPTK
jgi:hypothetical protein